METKLHENLTRTAENHRSITETHRRFNAWRRSCVPLEASTQMSSVPLFLLIILFLFAFTVGARAQEPTTHIVNQDNVDVIFSGEGYTLSNDVKEDDVLDFQGEIDKNHDLVINKRVNIVSSTTDAVIKLHTVAASLTGEAPGNSFIVNAGASGSVIKGLRLENTQTLIYNVDGLRLEDMVMYVNDVKVGSGVGQTAIRYSKNVTLYNCNIYTENNGGASCLCLTRTSNSTIENCEVEGQGNIGHLIYLGNNFNTSDMPSGFVISDTGNTIKNCILKGNPTGGNSNPLNNGNADYTTIDGVTVYVNGSLQTGSYATLTNCKIYSDCEISVGANSEATNNVVYGTGTTSVGANSNVHGNTLKNIKVSGATATFTDNTVNGDVTIRYKMASCTGNTILGSVTLSSGSMNNNNTISGNTIVSTGAYAVVVNSTGNTIENNTLISARAMGDAAVQITGTTNTVQGNTGAAAITSETTTLTATDAGTYYCVPELTTVNISTGDLKITPAEGSVSPKINIILCEGAALAVSSGKITATDVQMNISSISNGGTVGAMTANAIECGELNVNGGNITIGSISASGNITLGWTDVSDWIYASGFSSASGKVSIAANQSLHFVDGDGKTVKLRGELTDEQLQAMGGQSLKPYGGYCGKTDTNGGKNVTWDMVPDNEAGTVTLLIEKNPDASSNSNSMASYDDDTNRAPWSSFDITDITIGDGVNSIGTYAFYGCTSLTTLNLVQSTTSVKSLGSNALEGCTALKAIFVPSESLEKSYRTNSGWKNFNSKIFVKEQTLFAADAGNEWMTLCDAAVRQLPAGCEAWRVSGVSGGEVTAVPLEATATVGGTEVSVVPAYLPVLIHRTTDVPEGGFLAGFVEAGELSATNGWANNDGVYGNTAYYGYENVVYDASDGSVTATLSTSNEANVSDVLTGNTGMTSTAVLGNIKSGDYASYALVNNQFYRYNNSNNIVTHHCALSVANRGGSANASRQMLALNALGLGNMLTATTAKQVINEERLIGGTLAYYDDADCTNRVSVYNVTVGATIYVKPQSDGTHTMAGFTADNITVYEIASTMQARHNSPAATENIPVGSQTIAVTAVEGKPGVFQFKMPADENLGAGVCATFPEKTVATAPVSYIATNGTATDTGNNTVYILDGTETVLGIKNESNNEPYDTWYVANSGLSYTNTIASYGNVHIILADGVTMDITTTSSYALYNSDNYNVGNIAIYGQTNGTGTLNATSTSTNGIRANRGSVTISHCIVNASGGWDGIYANNDIVLAGSTVTASSYTSPVKIATGLVYNDGEGNYYAGTLTDGERNAIESKTLSPTTAISLADDASNAAVIGKLEGITGLDVTLTGRKLYKDGKWNTLCLPFDVTLAGSPLAGATARTLTAASISGTTLNLTFGGEETTKLTAGTPYIIKWAAADTNIENPTFSGVTIDADMHPYDTKTASPAVTTEKRVRFLGTYESTTFESEDKSILFLGAANTLYYPSPSGNQNPTIGAQRAYFKIGEDNQQARMLTAFNVDFGDAEATDILTISEVRSKMSDAWYSIDGRKIDGKPTAKGIYVNNGRMVVIK